jgi:hypothetical protein
MNLNEILEKKIESFLKEKNEKLIETINFLVDEFEKNQTELVNLLDEIEDTPIQDDFFFKNLKKEEYKKKASTIEEKIVLIEKRWSELILILNQRFNKK